MTPHRCPVCAGKGIVGPGFYSPLGSISANATEEKCRSCDGKGLVWEPRFAPPLSTNAALVIHYPRCAQCGATISGGYHSCPTIHAPTVKWI